MPPLGLVLADGSLWKPNMGLHYEISNGEPSTLTDSQPRHTSLAVWSDAQQKSDVENRQSASLIHYTLAAREPSSVSRPERQTAEVASMVKSVSLH